MKIVFTLDVDAARKGLPPWTIALEEDEGVIRKGSGKTHEEAAYKAGIDLYNLMEYVSSEKVH